MIKKLKPKSEFAKNVLTLMTGTTIAQAIPIAISPILTRLYTPEDFGVFALFISIVSFFSLIVSGKYEMAIVLPKTEKEAINILALSLLITIVMVLIVFFLILFFKENILDLLNIQKIGNLIYLVPFAIFLSGIYQSFNYWFNRKKKYKKISFVRISQSLFMSGIQVLLGYIKFNGGLIIGNVFGKMISVMILINEFFKYDKLKIKKINKKIIVLQLKKYKDFPLVNSFHALSDAIRDSGSIALLSFLFGSVTLGFYSLSMRVLQAPIGIIGSAMGQVLYQKFAYVYNNDQNLYEYVKKVFFLLVLIGLPIFVILYLTAPTLFIIIFGDKWGEAGEYSQILIPYLFMKFLLSPLSFIPLILNKQKEFFYISLLGNFLLIFLIVFFNSFGIIILLKIISFVMSIYSMFVIYWLYKILKKESIRYE